MIDETLFDAEEKMEKAVSVARDDLSSIRTGRANPGMFSRINDRLLRLGDPDHAAVEHQRARGPAGRHQAVRGRPAAQHRGRDPQLRPRRQPDQRRQRHPGRHPAADRGTSPRPGQAGQVQGRGRQGVGAQHPPQGDGGAAPHQEGRRGRRGRGGPRREGPRQDHAPVHRTRSTSWSSTKKASCWRSRWPISKRLPWQTPTPARRAAARRRRGPGATCPPRSPWASLLGAMAIAILLFAPIGWLPVLRGGDADRHPRGGPPAARGRLRASRRFRC